MSVQLTILCETVLIKSALWTDGEHGFACHLRTDTRNYLFDTGGGLTVLNNAEKLKIDLRQLDGILFSHGHVDHTGGIKQVLEKSGPLPVYAHPDLFCQRYSNNGGHSSSQHRHSLVTQRAGRAGSNLYSELIYDNNCPRHHALR